MKNITKLVMLLIMVATLMVALVSCEQEPKVKYVDKKADSTAPAKVTNLAATPKDTQVLLTWTDAEDEDVYGYEVSYIQTSAENSSRVVLAKLEAKTIVVSPGTGGCYVTGLTNDTEYTFTVKTVDTSGNKSEGATVTGKPVEATADIMEIKISIPEEPTKSSLTATIKITNANKIKRVVYKKNGSEIAKKLLDDEEVFEAKENNDDNSTWTFTITPKDESANGYYTVAAIDVLGREETAAVWIKNFDFTPRPNVTKFDAGYDPKNGKVSLSWLDPEEETSWYKNSALEYIELSYTVNGGEEETFVENIPAGTQKTEFMADKDKIYYTFIARSVDKLGNKSEGATIMRPVKTSNVTFVTNDGSVIPDQTVYYNKCIERPRINGKSVLCYTNSELTESFSLLTPIIENKTIYVKWIDVPDDFVVIDNAVVNTAVENSEIFVEGCNYSIPDMMICDHEVTQAEYTEYMTWYGSAQNNSRYQPTSEKGLGDNYPAYNISWYDAIIYCNLRSIKENLTPVYYMIIEEEPETDVEKWRKKTSWIGKDSNGKYIHCFTDQSEDTSLDEIKIDSAANGYRLPTEAEWEYIAREANTSNTRYSGSDNLSEVGWYGTAHEIKLKLPNKLGIYDMTGNIGEWCWDIYPNALFSRVVRGGSFHDSGLWDLDINCRYTVPPALHYFGVRLVRTLQ